MTGAASTPRPPGAGPRAVLIGLPGAGKSGAGRRLADRLGVPFADSDAFVEAQAGRTVAELFAVDGEPAFRRLEAAAIAEAMARFEGVLSLGGGAVLEASTRHLLRASGVPVVHLVTTVAAAVRYTRGGDRPLLRDDPAGALERLRTERTPLYDEVATARVTTGGRPWPEIVMDLVAAISVPVESGREGAAVEPASR